MEIKNIIKNIFSIDFRALGIFRIFLGLILIFDLIVRSLSLTAHYTNFGVLPLNVPLDRFVNLIIIPRGSASVGKKLK